MVPLSYYLVLSAILFACGVAGFLIKRNIITIFMSIELMLNAVNLTFVAFAAQLKQLERPGLCVLRDGGGRGRSRCWIGNHYFRLPDARNPERRSRELCLKAMSLQSLDHSAVAAGRRRYQRAAGQALFQGAGQYHCAGLDGAGLRLCAVGGGAVLGPAAEQIPYIEQHVTWMAVGAFSRCEFGFWLDQLSLVMLLVVTGVGFVIHIFSVGYMAHEGGYYRYFAYLNIFMFFMLTLVLANNYLLMFVGWEGVGLASYLLIGFWFLKQSAADAGKKAFITNRVGDFGFLIALFLLIKHFGTLQYDGVFKAVARVRSPRRRPAC